MISPEGWVGPVRTWRGDPYEEQTATQHSPITWLPAGFGVLLRVPGMSVLGKKLPFLTFFIVAQVPMGATLLPTPD